MTATLTPLPRALKRMSSKSAEPGGNVSPIPKTSKSSRLRPYSPSKVSVNGSPLRRVPGVNSTVGSTPGAVLVAISPASSLPVTSGRRVREVPATPPM